MDLKWQKLAGTAYRRTGMSWRAIGKHLGVDKDRIREAIKADGREDGWSETDPLRPHKRRRTRNSEA
jgi:transposase